MTDGVRKYANEIISASSSFSSDSASATHRQLLSVVGCSSVKLVAAAVVGAGVGGGCDAVAECPDSTRVDRAVSSPQSSAAADAVGDAIPGVR